MVFLAAGVQSETSPDRDMTEITEDAPDTTPQPKQLPKKRGWPKGKAEGTRKPRQTAEGPEVGQAI